MDDDVCAFVFTPDARVAKMGRRSAKWFDKISGGTKCPRGYF